MTSVRITAVRRACHQDLIDLYENPLENPCDVNVGDVFISIDGQRPEDLCESAWHSMEYFVKSLAEGKGNFYDGM